MMGKHSFAAWLVTLLMLPVPVLAQGWQFSQSDDGVVFSARLDSPDESAFSLMCAERTPWAPDVLPVYYEQTVLTRPDELYLVLGDRQFIAPAEPFKRNDVLIVFANSAFRLPETTWDDYTPEWNTILQASGPMFDMIAAVPSFEIHSNTGVLRVTSAGFSAGYAKLLDTCRSRFAAIGKPWLAPASIPVVPAAPGQSGQSIQPGQSMQRAAQAAINPGCGGYGYWTPDAILVGEIDGDGIPDAILDWGEVTCSGTMARPNCGASHCLSEIFLSRTYPNRLQSEQLLGLGVGLQPLSNGNMAVVVGGSLSNCRDVGKGDSGCKFLYYWNGFELVQLP